MDEFEREQYLAFLAEEKKEKESIEHKELTSATLLSTIMGMGIPWDMACTLTLGQLWELMEEIHGKQSRASSEQGS